MRLEAEEVALSPRSLDQALAWMAEDPALLPVAGGTDLMVTDALKRVEMRRVIDLLRIPELQGIRGEGEQLEIGAAATFAEIGRDATVRERFPALAAAAQAVGGRQIQTRATLGGNIANASPAADSPPILLALGASVIAASVRGERTIPYDQFHVAYRRTCLHPGEIVRAVRLPWPSPGAVQAFRKVGTRAAQAISKVAVAMLAGVRDGRISELRLGAASVAATPVRLLEAEGAAIGQRLDAQLVERVAAIAAQEITPIDDVRSSAEYRRFALAQVVRRMLLNLPTGA